MSDAYPCVSCGNDATTQRTTYLDVRGWTTSCCMDGTCMASGPLRATEVQSIEAWNALNRPDREALVKVARLAIARCCGSDAEIPDPESVVTEYLALEGAFNESAT